MYKKNKKNKKIKTPIKCKSFNDICNLPRDNISFKDFWILTDGYVVSIHQQKIGQTSTQGISIPRTVFDRFVRWYTTGSTNKGA